MMGSQHKRRRAFGYTLIELLIVIGLLGLATTLLIPYMVGRSGMETQAAVRMIIADLSFAQSDALARQEYRRIYFFDDGTGYAIIRVTDETFNDPFDPDTADYIYDPLASYGGKYIVNFKDHQRFEDINISSVSIDNGQRYITYDHVGGTVMTGGDPGTGGQITLTSDQGTYHIDIAPFTGKLTVMKD